LSRNKHVKDYIGISRHPGKIRINHDENANTSHFGTKMINQYTLQFGGDRFGGVEHGSARSRKGEITQHSSRVLSRGLLGIAPLKSLVITVDEQTPEVSGAVVRLRFPRPPRSSWLEYSGQWVG